jgi:large subunit ribosomal protein L9
MSRSVQAILTADVDRLGTKGDVVNVSRGYLRNFLSPRGLAHQATAGEIAEQQRRAVQREAQLRRAEENARETADILSKTVLTIPAKAGPDGRLFGSVTADDVAKQIASSRKIRIDRRKIRIEDAIRETGTFLVDIDVHGDVSATIKLIVTGTDCPPASDRSPATTASMRSRRGAPAATFAHLPQKFWGKRAEFSE